MGNAAAGKTPSPEPLPRALSVRTHLAAIVGVLALTLIGAGTYQISQAFSKAREQARLDTGFQARLAAESLSTSMEEGEAFTAATAASPSIAQVFAAIDEDGSVCSLTAGGTGLFPEGSIHFLNPAGSLFCSSVAERIEGRGTEYGALEWFPHAIVVEPGSAVVAAPFVDPATGKTSVAFAAPVPGPSGRAMGLVVYALPLDGVAAAMMSTYGGRARLAFDVTWTATGQVASSSEEATHGTEAPGWDAKTPPEGAVAGWDGVRRFYRAVRASGTGFTVTAGVPESVTLADARARLWEQFGLTVLALAVTLVLGLLVNRRIGGPLRRLTRSVDESGRAVTPQPVEADGPREIRALVEAFNGMLAARASVEDQLQRRAMFDELTGLPNRTVALDRLSHALEQTRRAQDLVAVLAIDLDRFSLVNESLGRDAGDRMLIQVGRRLRSVLRPEDTLARFYGDEFVVLCEGIRAAEDAGLVASRIARSLRKPIRDGELEATISVSIGIAVGSYGKATAASLLEDADAARTMAKKRGKARHEFYEEAMREGSSTRFGLENDLRRAVERDEMKLVYQPIIDLGSNRIVGAEALMRWHHPTKGALMPGVFIDMAEETGLIVPLGHKALQQACAQAAEWSSQGHPIRVSVNLSPKQISEPDLVDDIAAAMRGASIDPSLLCIEITENTLMREEAAGAVLDRIRDLGVRISVDDFGTGYSSLAYLQRFSLDELKIDRSFIRDLGREASAPALVAAIMGVASALGLSVVVEGIEESVQLEHVRALGCQAAQGFLFMRPQPPSDIAPLLELDAVRLPVETEATGR